MTILETFMKWLHNHFSKRCEIYNHMLNEAYKTMNYELYSKHYYDIIRLCKYQARRVKSGKNLNDETQNLLKTLKAFYE